MKITIDIPTWEPEVEEIWDNNDWPEKPTAADLEKKILEEIEDLGFIDWLINWNLLHETLVFINEKIVYEFKLFEDGTPDENPAPNWDE